MSALELQINVMRPSEIVRLTLNAQESACVEELLVTHGLDGNKTEAFWKTHETLSFEYKATVGFHTLSIDFVGYLPSGVLSLPEQTVALCGVLPKIVNFTNDTIATHPNIWNPKTPPLKLRQISERLFEKNGQITHLIGTFAGLRNLKHVPERLLAPLAKAVSFAGLFEASGLELIPENLFSANTNLQDLTRTFNACRKLQIIPEELFRRNNKAKNFTETFSKTSVRSIPVGLFRHVARKGSFVRTFAEDNIKEVPEGLFAGKAPANIDGIFEVNGPITEADPLKLMLCARLPRSFFDDVRTATGVPTLSRADTL